MQRTPDEEAFCRAVLSILGSFSKEPARPTDTVRSVPPEFWLRYLEGLTADPRPTTTCSDTTESMEDLDATSSAPVVVVRPRAVPQQPLAETVRYGFESCRKTYFEVGVDPNVKGPLLPSKHQKGVSCDFPPDYKCKQSPYPIITMCDSVPLGRLCGRCGSIGNQLMVRCLGCCDVFHYFCAHLPESLVPRLTSWYCHRCAVCSLCCEKEQCGKKFISDIIETCHRCHGQFHVNCNRSNNFINLYRDSSREVKICNGCFSRSTCRNCRAGITIQDLVREVRDLPIKICLVCRNSKEAGLCSICFDLSRKEDSPLLFLTCQDCKDVWHMECWESGSGTLQLNFKCGCKALDCHEPETETSSWNCESADRILGKLRKFILTCINAKFAADNPLKIRTAETAIIASDITEKPKLNLENSVQRVNCVSDLAKKLDHSVNNFANMDYEIAEPAEQPEILFLMGYSPVRRPSISTLTDRQLDSAMAEVILSSASSRLSKTLSNYGQNNLSSASNRLVTAPTTNDLLWHWFSSFLTSGGKVPDGWMMPETVESVEVTDPLFFMDSIYQLRAPEAVLTNPFVMNYNQQSIYTHILHRLDSVGRDPLNRESPSILADAITQVLSSLVLSVTDKEALRIGFADSLKELSISVQLNGINSASERPTVRQLQFPSFRQADAEVPLIDECCFLNKGKAENVDGRMCLFCTVAGDDRDGVAGRLLSVGYDLWAHVGCMSFAATAKCHWDYTLMKMMNLESQAFRRTVCAACPVRMGIVGCVNKRCRNSYHLNCAISERCSILSRIGVMCPLHNEKSFYNGFEVHVHPVEPENLQREFSDKPVYCRAAVTNVRNLGNSCWSSGIQKEQVKVHIGGAFVEDLGKLLRGWETTSTMLPCGYRAQRQFWSTKDPKQLAWYSFVILDMNAHREVIARICEIIERETIPDRESLDAYVAEKSLYDIIIDQDMTVDQKCEETLFMLSLTEPSEADFQEIPPQLPVPPKTIHEQPLPAPGTVTLLAETAIDEMQSKPLERCESPEIPIRSFLGIHGSVMTPPSTSASSTSRTAAEPSACTRFRARSIGKFFPQSETRTSNKRRRLSATPTSSSGTLVSDNTRARSSLSEYLSEASSCPKFDLTPPSSCNSSRDASPSPTRRVTRSTLNAESLRPRLSRHESLCSRPTSITIESEIRNKRRKFAKTPTTAPRSSPLSKLMSESPLVQQGNDVTRSRLITPALRKQVTAVRSIGVTKVRRHPPRSQEISPDKLLDDNSAAKISITKIGQQELSVPSEKSSTTSSTEFTSTKKNRARSTVKSAADRFRADVEKDEKSVPDELVVKRPATRASSGGFCKDIPMRIFCPDPDEERTNSPLQPRARVKDKVGVLEPRRVSTREKKKKDEVSVEEMMPPAIVVERVMVKKGDEIERKPSILKWVSGAGRSRPVGTVIFAEKISEEKIKPRSFGHIAEPTKAPEFGPYFAPLEDLDPQPGLFETVKSHGRQEKARRKCQQVRNLYQLIQSSDLGKTSKQPTQLCILMGSDGFLVASHFAEELVDHLYQQLHRARAAFGMLLKIPNGITTGPSPLEFVCLGYPVVQFLLEQLPVPVSPGSSYIRKFFNKEALKGRSRGDLEPSKMTLFNRRSTCSTCPLGAHCFEIRDDRTFTKVPVRARQVMFKWTVPCYSHDQKVWHDYIRVTGTLHVDPDTFPDFYEKIRHSQRQTCILTYAVHAEEKIITLALIAKADFPIWTEIKFDPAREAHGVNNVLGVCNFSCLTHGRLS